MALENYRPIQFPEKTELDSTDVVLIDSATNGTNKYQLNRIAAQASAETAAAVAAEAQARQAADAAEVTARNAAISAAISDEVTARNAAIAANVDDTLTVSGKSADAKKTGDEIADLKSDLSQEVTNRTAAVSAEASARAAADSALQTAVNAKASQTDLTAEATARANADSALQTAVNAKASQADLTAEVSARQAADDALAADIATKANADGVAENLTSGQTKQLLSDVYATDSEPYFFRPTGGSVNASVGDREYDTIVGGTVAWNQLVSISSLRTETMNGMTITNNQDGSSTISGTCTGRNSLTIINLSNSAGNLQQNHVYYLRCLPSNGITGSAYGGIAGLNLDKGSGGLFKMTYDFTSTQLRVDIFEGDVFDNAVVYPQYIDLTAAFGATIADYIYSLETATAGAGVSFFRKLFPRDYYPYDAGTLKSVEGLSAHETVGFNQWDEEWELGAINASNGTNVSDSTRIRTKNYIRVLPDTNYFFGIKNYSGQVGTIAFYDADKNFVQTEYTPANTVLKTPKNIEFMKIGFYVNYGTTYNHDICINLSWDGERNGEYEEYVKHSYPLDDSLTLRGILKLDASNRPYFDGDTYEADGTVMRRYGVVDLGSLNWTWVEDSRLDAGGAFRSQNLSNVKQSGQIVNAKYLCFPATGFTTLIDRYGSGVDKVMTSNQNVVYVIDSTYDTDAATFKTAMSGVYLVYELATPTPETADPFQIPQIVDDFGTEEYVTTSIVPVGHTTKYPENLRAKIEGLPWDFSTLIAPTEKTNKATRNYTSGSLLIMGNVLYKVTANIANGGTITPGTNVTATTLSEVILALA